MRDGALGFCSYLGNLPLTHTISISQVNERYGQQAYDSLPIEGRWLGFGEAGS